MEWLHVGCSLGANAYWSAAFHVYTPLPFRPGRGFGDLFRTHFFVNAGSLNNVKFGKLSVGRVASAEALDRWGGKINYHLIPILSEQLLREQVVKIGNVWGSLKLLGVRVVSFLGHCILLTSVNQFDLFVYVTRICWLCLCHYLSFAEVP